MPARSGFHSVFASPRSTRPCIDVAMGGAAASIEVYVSQGRFLGGKGDGERKML